LYKLRDLFKIKYDNTLKILSIVRNPYERIISDLFWRRIMSERSNRDEVCDSLKKFIVNTMECKNKYDNHNIPQYKFLIDDDGNISSNIIIIKRENLTDNMKSLGYSDFDIKINANPLNVDYYDYLNDTSIKIINNIYHKDFVLFGYEKIKTKNL
jgi:hypothetical protein